MDKEISHKQAAGRATSSAAMKIIRAQATNLALLFSQSFSWVGYHTLPKVIYILPFNEGRISFLFLSEKFELDTN